jgi:hypothetical protein
MIKAFLLLLLSFCISFSASAQWWKKTHQTRLPLLQASKTNLLDFTKTNRIKPVDLKPTVQFGPTQYNYDTQEAYIMKGLYHSLRFHQTKESLDGFNSLVALYIQESRYSEAKWYLLQCNYLGHKNNDSGVIISSLVSLGMLKADIGEYVQAKEDLLEAQGICLSQGRAADVADINKKLKLVETKRFANVKNDVRYAEVEEDKKG